MSEAHRHGHYSSITFDVECRLGCLELTGKENRFVARRVLIPVICNCCMRFLWSTWDTKVRRTGREVKSHCSTRILWTHLLLMWENTRVTEDSTPHNTLANNFVTDYTKYRENFQTLTYFRETLTNYRVHKKYLWRWKRVRWGLRHFKFGCDPSLINLILYFSYQLFDTKSQETLRYATLTPLFFTQCNARVLEKKFRNNSTTVM